MATDLLFGIQTNGIKHTHADPMPEIDTRFRMVRDAGVFDYVDKTPAPGEVREFLAARDRYGIPVRAGGWFYTLGRDEDLLVHNLEVGRDLGSLVHNVQFLANHADGHEVTDDEVVSACLRAAEAGDRIGVTPCFEVHVNMWSEDFRRVDSVGRSVESHGVPFNMTLDHSHVIFKIDNPEEQDIGGIREAVAAGEVVLDPYAPGNVCQRWIDFGWVRHCHARAAVPNNPKNVAAVDEDGNPGRGIQYPFKQPAPGEYHAEWREAALEPWKEVIRALLRHHAADDAATLGQISTEFIPNLDYGEGCQYSLFEQAIACVEWMRATWAELRPTTH
ncbi:MAG: hypothetical protein OXF40_04300 [Rhodospirillales bacterium]|nr:hypothetical protein [Rhodospirillales bacterium]